VKGWPKWWLVSVAALGILTGLGKNFSSINYFLFDHFPYYNKFRAPTIALILPNSPFLYWGPWAAATDLWWRVQGGGLENSGWRSSSWEACSCCWPGIIFRRL